MSERGGRPASLLCRLSSWKGVVFSPSFRFPHTAEDRPRQQASEPPRVALGISGPPWSLEPAQGQCAECSRNCAHSPGTQVPKGGPWESGPRLWLGSLMESGSPGARGLSTAFTQAR